MSKHNVRVFKRQNSDVIREQLEEDSISSSSSIADDTDEDPDFCPMNNDHSYSKGNIFKIGINVPKNKSRQLDNELFASEKLGLGLNTKYANYEPIPSTSKPNVDGYLLSCSNSLESNRPIMPDCNTQNSIHANNYIEGNNIGIMKPNNVESTSSTPQTNTLQEVVRNKPKVKRAKSGLANPDEWKRNKLKRARLSGEEYETASKVTKPAKQCNLNNCNCPLKCSQKLPDDRRVFLFNQFYKNLSTWNEQNAFLVGSVILYDKKKSYGSNDSKREKTRHYFLKDETGNDIHVCKKFFQNTLQVSSGRLDRALKGSTDNGFPKPDARGKHVPKNKRSEDDEKCIVEFINSFPKYKSHYTRKQNPNKEFFAPGMTPIKLYNLYCSKCEESGVKAKSRFVFSDTFKKNFNIGFHRPQKDTCKTCDMLQNKIKHAQSGKAELEKELDLHHIEVEIANEAYETDKRLCMSDKDTLVFTFDLMKTLPTPFLSTGLVYYKRQLWTFCFGIHDTRENNGYMKVWNETTASRGPSEIASGLIHYLKMKKLETEIVAWSDACGGQNRNIFMTLFWLHVVTSEDYKVDTIKHKFFVSGHSYNDSDKDFGLIERSKPTSGVYVPSHWADVIRNAKKSNPFVVSEMSLGDFFDIKALKKFIIHRKTDTQGNKVKWLKMALIEVRRNSPNSIFFKYSHNANEPYRELDITKSRSSKSAGQSVGSLGSQTLQKLNKTPVPLTPAKVADLKSLLPYIPPVYQEFYNNLQDDNTKEYDTLPGVEDEEEDED